MTFILFGSTSEGKVSVFQVLLGLGAAHRGKDWGRRNKHGRRYFNRYRQMFCIRLVLSISLRVHFFLSIVLEIPLGKPSHFSVY